MDPTKIIIVIIVTAIVALVVKRGIKKALQQNNIHDGLKTFLISFKPISNILIWGFGLLVAVQLLSVQYHLPFSEHLVINIKELFIIVMVTWLLLNWKGRYENLLIERLQEGKSKIRDESLISGISKILTIALLIFSGMIILQIFEFDYAAIIAFGGLGGLAVSWAAKDVIANFFGGLMIHINRPFSIGDLIKSPNKHFEGIVEQIGWYMTRIRSLERRPTYIPNALFTDAIIENTGRMYHRRIRTTFGVRYQDFPLIQPIMDEIKSMLHEHPDVIKNQMLMVNFVAFNQYSIDMEVYCFTKKAPLVEFRETQQDILLKIGKIIEKHGAEIAFPTQTILMPSGKS